MNNLKLVIAISFFLGFSQNAFSSHDPKNTGFGDLEKEALKGLVMQLKGLEVACKSGLTLKKLEEMKDCQGELLAFLKPKYLFLLEKRDSRTELENEKMALMFQLLKTNTSKLKEAEKMIADCKRLGIE